MRNFLLGLTLAATLGFAQNASALGSAQYNAAACNPANNGNNDSGFDLITGDYPGDMVPGAVFLLSGSTGGGWTNKSGAMDVVCYFPDPNNMGAYLSGAFVESIDNSTTRDVSMVLWAGFNLAVSFPAGNGTSTGYIPMEFNADSHPLLSTDSYKLVRLTMPVNTTFIQNRFFYQF
jgi:hypothetical protein